MDSCVQKVIQQGEFEYPKKDFDGHFRTYLLDLEKLGSIGEIFMRSKFRNNDCTTNTH